MEIGHDDRSMVLLTYLLTYFLSIDRSENRSSMQYVAMFYVAISYVAISL